MKKNSSSIKQRRASAKRGKKKSDRKRESKSGKYLRETKKKEEQRLKQRKLENLINQLSNVKPEGEAFADVSTTPNEYNNDNLFKG